jgi:hypothetical protein
MEDLKKILTAAQLTVGDPIVNTIGMVLIPIPAAEYQRRNCKASLQLRPGYLPMSSCFNASSSRRLLSGPNKEDCPVVFSSEPLETEFTTKNPSRSYRALCTISSDLSSRGPNFPYPREELPLYPGQKSSSYTELGSAPGAQQCKLKRWWNLRSQEQQPAEALCVRGVGFRSLSVSAPTPSCTTDSSYIHWSAQKP